MKGLKSKLMAATAMLTVSAVMLVSTSFAWYTLSTNPEVKGISATAVANENLEIALDNGYSNGSEVNTASALETKGPQGSKTEDNYTWGNLVDVTKILTDVELRPAAYDSQKNESGLYTVKYGDDGRVDSSETIKLTESTVTKGAKDAGTQTLTSGDVKYAFKVNYWLKTNKAGTISLTTASERAKDSGITEQGNGSTLTVTQEDENKKGAEGTQNLTPDDFSIVFKVTKDGGTATWKPATIDTDGKITCENLITVGADDVDTAYKVEMYVFLDGTKVTNADADKTGAVSVNVQFANNAVTSAMKK